MKRENKAKLSQMIGMLLDANSMHNLEETKRSPRNLALLQQMQSTQSRFEIGGDTVNHREYELKETLNTVSSNFPAPLHPFEARFVRNNPNQLHVTAHKSNFPRPQRGGFRRERLFGP